MLIDVEIKALTILENYSNVLLDNVADLDCEDLQYAIKQLKHLEHYAHRTQGLRATDRSDLIKDKISHFKLECEAFKEKVK